MIPDTSGTCSTPHVRYVSSRPASPTTSTLGDRKLQLAVERAFEIIGEAARLVSPTFKANHAEVPWKVIIGQRNVLAHEYGEINQERIWLVASRRIPELIELLEPLLPPPPTV